jgi:pyruvate formate lyase activating enzyme
MKIGGVQKLSLVDYPGKTSAALFTIGCNMRCGYCHNPDLVLPERAIEPIPLADIMVFLCSRVGKLQGVVVSGGEPTVHDDLPEMIRDIKRLGFLVKLDTNGTHPGMLRQLFGEALLDFVAMDIKGPLEKYQEIAAYPIDIEAISESIQLIQQSGVEHEFRTTVVKSQLEPSDFAAIGKLVKGSPRFALQKFRPGRTLNPRFARELTYTDDEFAQFKQTMERYVGTCVVH